ncbi:MAG: class I adenylate-forming enzyme family protein [Xanthobacteraceae bacterium]
MPMEMPKSRTIPALLDEQAERYGDLEALVGGTQRYTYRSLRERVRAFAKGLSALGVRKGSRVAILMGNKPEWVIADLAICSLGAVMIAVNTWVTRRELHYILDHSDADTLIFAGRFLKYDYARMLEEMQPHGKSLPKLKQIIHVGDGYRDSVPFDQVYELGRTVTDDTIDAAAAAVDPEDVAYVLYTSGSTSTPKGAQMQHYGIIENPFYIGNRMHVEPGDRCWLAVSLFWGLGCENALPNMYTHGGCVVLQEYFEPGEALRLIEQERCTIYYGMPNMSQAMYDHPDREKRDLSSLRSGGQLGTLSQFKVLVDLGVKEACHIYGLTETFGNCNVSDGRLDPRDKVFATLGRPLDGVIQRIANPETNEELPAGEIGEIQVKRYVTLGYYNDEDKNREAFTPDGYFRTGDLGFYDEGGYLHFRGRIKETIKTGGLNVAPAEIETILTQLPGVNLAYVVGIPDPVRDEVVGAVIVPHGEPAEDMSAKLSAELSKQVSKFKVPLHYRFVKEADLPLTKSGKVQKNRLVELFKR